jgi:adenylate kinase family enzyme
MQRISVVGTSGAGKTTFARDLAARLGVSHVELDAIFHQPDWTPLDDDEFARRVAAATEGDAWVTDGNYRRVTMDGPVWARADTVVWIDPPDRVIMSQVVTRTLARTIGRRELWNGNRESFRNVFRRDPHRSIIAWAWSTRNSNRVRYRQAMIDPAHAHLRFVRLGSRRQARAFLDALGRLPEHGSGRYGSGGVSRSTEVESA